MRLAGETVILQLVRGKLWHAAQQTVKLSAQTEGEGGGSKWQVWGKDATNPPSPNWCKGHLCTRSLCLESSLSFDS